MEKITIRAKDMVETKEVDSEIIGHLAVHLSWLSNDNPCQFFTITHIPTGANLPVLSEIRKAVVACAKELADLVDWDFSDRNSAAGLKEVVVPVIDSWGVGSELKFH